MGQVCFRELAASLALGRGGLATGSVERACWLSQQLDVTSTFMVFSKKIWKMAVI